MKVSLLQENLTKALNTASRFISAKAQLPILNNFLLEAKEGQLIISATNLELGISLVVPAKVEKEGGICIPARVLAELVAGLPKEKVDLLLEDFSLKITCGKHKSVLNGMSHAEFPAIPKQTEKPQIVFQSTTLIEVASQVGFSASIDEGRPPLTGVLVGLKKDGFSFVATDGFRLSLKNIKSNDKVIKEEASFLIPARAFLEAGKISQDKNSTDEKEVGLSLLPDGNQVLFIWEGALLSSRLIDGKFPPYEKIIPSQITTKIVFDKEELLKTIKIASIFARESANIIKIKISGQKVKISANTPQVGENENEVSAKVEGTDNEIAFNSRYLLDYLNSLSSEQVQLEMTGPLSPGLFRVPGDPSFLHIVMPVRVQN